jgi:hypothetical protein
MTKKNRMKRVKKDADTGAQIVKVPGVLVADDLVSTSFRFFANSAETATAITRGALLNLLVLAATTSTAYRMIQAIRLRRVHVWTSAPATASTSESTSMQWAAGYSRPSTKVTTTIGAAGVSYQSSVPPKRSLADDWSIAGTAESDPMFSIVFNAGDIIQLDVTYQLQNNVASEYSAASVTGGSMAVGYVYAVSLDHSVNKVLIPVGRLTNSAL